MLASVTVISGSDSARPKEKAASVTVEGPVLVKSTSKELLVEPGAAADRLAEIIRSAPAGSPQTNRVKAVKSGRRASLFRVVMWILHGSVVPILVRTMATSERFTTPSPLISAK